MNKHQFINIIKDHLNIRQKPLTLQMPITSRCNSRCKTCNVWKYKDNIDINPESLRNVLSDSFLSDVVVVGINGGEFTLVPDFLKIIDAVLSLPKIKSIYLITNGLFPKRLFEYLQEAYTLCKGKDVNMHLCLSIDGVDKVHEYVRGIPNCFIKTKEILDKMTTERDKYCSSFSVGCTISVHNVQYIKETRDFLENYPGLEVEYHCAIPNKRIKTFDDADYYIANNDQKRLLATEFFYEQYLNAKTQNKRYQNFANYYFLKNGCKQRLNTCAYINRDVTIDENLDLSLCATASDIIGNLKENTASHLLKSQRAKDVRKKVSKYCSQCGHYTYHPLNIYGRFAYIKELVRRDFLYPYFKTYSQPESYTRSKEITRLYLRVIKRFIIYSYQYIWKLQ